MDLASTLSFLNLTFFQTLISPFPLSVQQALSLPSVRRALHFHLYIYPRPIEHFIIDLFNLSYVYRFTYACMLSSLKHTPHCFVLWWCTRICTQYSYGRLIPCRAQSFLPILESTCVHSFFSFFLSDWGVHSFLLSESSTCGSSGNGQVRGWMYGVFVVLFSVYELCWLVRYVV